MTVLILSIVNAIFRIILSIIEFFYECKNYYIFYSFIGFIWILVGILEYKNYKISKWENKNE
jgi:uncharacterized membrane protein HdeD (DUF308 family)